MLFWKIKVDLTLGKCNGKDDDDGIDDGNCHGIWHINFEW